MSVVDTPLVSSPGGVDDLVPRLIQAQAKISVSCYRPQQHAEIWEFYLV
jgi:hypothetical protein